VKVLFFFNLVIVTSVSFGNVSTV